MKTLIDFQGRPVRLTDERRQHILEHPEMAGMESALAETLRDPQLVIRSRTDETATLNYRTTYVHWLAAVAVRCGKIRRCGCVRVDGVSDGQTETR